MTRHTLRHATALETIEAVPSTRARVRKRVEPIDGASTAAWGQTRQAQCTRDVGLRALRESHKV